MTYKAREIADYFLWKGEQLEEENDLSNLKLQKLLYYARGFSLALLDRPCFSDPINAWPHGPVVVAVYEDFKNHRGDVIPSALSDGLPTLDAETVEVLDEVFDVYGHFSAWRLRDMTHAERPWQEAVQRNEISHESLRSFFKTRVRE